jgi:hypothetical protein
MKEQKNVSRRWRTTAVLALGVVVGVVLMATPAASHIGSVTHLWNHHIKPKADARYLQRTIQAGRTVRGTIGNEDQVSGTDVEVSANASLPGVAPFALDDQHVTVDGTLEDTGKCNGSVANPTATAGWVCIYPYYTNNVASAQGYIWGSGDGEVKTGFQASIFSSSGPEAGFFATWAYKAPAHALAKVVVPRSCAAEGGGC